MITNLHEANREDITEACRRYHLPDCLRVLVLRIYEQNRAVYSEDTAKRQALAAMKAWRRD